MPPTLVSVVLVNRNAGDLVDLVFPSIAAQSYPHLEVIVVDNGSTDRSTTRIRERYPGATILELGRNTGFSHALNVGIRESAGAYVLSLNFDVLLEREFVETLVRLLDERPEVGWAAGAMQKLTASGVLDSIDCNGHYMLPSRYCYGYIPEHPDRAFYDAPREVFGASACAAMYRRSMLESIADNGEVFDEDLFAYFEDIDVDWRAQQRGFRCAFTPAARGAHMRGGSGLSRQPAVISLLLANRFLVMLKNDDITDALRDLAPIVKRTLLDVATYGRQHPTVPFRTFSRVVRLAPRMLRKRRRIRSSRVPAASPIRRLRIPTRFLG